MVTNYGEEGEGQVKFYFSFTSTKRWAKKVLAMLKGGGGG